MTCTDAERRLVGLRRPTAPWCCSRRSARIGEVAKALVAAGRSADTPVAMTRVGTTTEQQTVVSTLGRIAADARAARMTPPAVTVVGDVVDLRDDAVVVRDQAAVRLAGAGAAHQGAGRLAVRAAARLRRGARGGADDLGRAAAHPAADGARPIRGLVEGRYEWIAFTSVNAVRAVREKFEEYGLDARAFAGLKVAAVGEKTAAALAAWGMRADLVPVRRAVRRAACSRTGRRTTRCSTRSTGSSCRAPTSPPRPWSPGWSSSAGRSTTSRPTAPCGPPRRRRRPARRSRPAGSTRSCSPRPRRCATWSASPASRTPRR